MIRSLLILSLAVSLCPATPAAQKRKAAPRPATTALRPANLEADPADLFPASTIFYAEVRDVPAALDQLGGTDALYKILMTMPWEAPPKIPITPEQFREALGSRIAIGVMPAAPNARKIAGRIAEPSAAIVIQAPSAQLMSTLQSIAVQSEAGKPPTTRAVPQKIGGHTAFVEKTTATEKDPVAYVFSGDTLVVGPVSGVRSLLTAAAGAGPKLSADPGYRSGMSRLSGRHNIFAYVNGRNLAKLANDAITAPTSTTTAKGRKTPPRTSPSSLAIKKFLGLDALTGITMTGTMEGSDFHVQTSVAVDRMRRGLVSILSDPPPINLKSAGFIPEDADVYYSASVDQIRIFDLLMEVATADVTREFGAPTAAEVIRKAEAEIGMSIRNEILPAFGNQFTFGYSDSKPAGGDGPTMTNEDIASGTTAGAGPQSSGHFYAIFEIRNAETVKRLILAMTANPNQARDISEQGGATVITQGTTSWAVVDGYLIMGEPADVTRALQAHSSGSSLMASKNFSTAAGTLSGDAINAVYLAPSAFEDVVKSQAGGMNPFTENPLPNGLFAAARKDGSGVFNDIRLPAGPAWKAFLDALTKK